MYGCRRRRASQHHTPCDVSRGDIAALAARVRPYLEVFAGPSNNSILEEEGLELSTFLRCYNYEVGDCSTPHYDRSATSTRGRHDVSTFSAYSILFYLNDGFDGGHTTFFEEHPSLTRTKCGIAAGCDISDEVRRTSVTPRRGSLLVFPHGRMQGCWPDPLHEGSVIHEGEKTIIRSDIVYKFVPKIKNFQKKCEKEEHRIADKGVAEQQGEEKEGS